MARLPLTELLVRVTLPLGNAAAIAMVNVVDDKAVGQSHVAPDNSTTITPSTVASDRAVGQRHRARKCVNAAAIATATAIEIAIGLTIGIVPAGRAVEQGHSAGTREDAAAMGVSANGNVAAD